MRTSHTLAFVATSIVLTLACRAASSATARQSGLSSAPAGTLHHLPASPQTVAFGYYHSGAAPVLRVRSGDEVEVTTMLTSSPERLERAGVAPADVEQALRDIYASVKDRGPGGHILTGPIYVEGADSGDVLEVRIKSIDLA